MASTTTIGDVGDSESNWNSSVTGPRTQVPRRARASKACLACRVRKVRCDVMQNGGRCTNCKIDGQSCIVPKRSRKHRQYSESQLQAFQSSGHDVSASVVDTQDTNIHGFESYVDDGVQQPSRRSTVAGVEIESHQLHKDQLPFEPYQTTQQDILGTDAPKMPPPMPDAERNILPNFARKAPQHFQYHVFASCYTFVNADFVSNTSAEDIEYLHHTGCLHLPQQNSLDVLVRAYFLYVHPHLPIIDEADFWNMYFAQQSDDRSPGRMPLLVLQTMLMVACGFVSPSITQGLGFNSVRTARTVYYRRAKVLYDFNVEKSNLAKAQGTLLMTFHVPLNEPQVNSYWLGVAIHHARAEGADRFPTFANRDPIRYNQLKRVWWSCIIRDRTMALGVRRPIVILSTSLLKAWPQLTVDDLKNEVGQSCVHSSSVKLELLQSLLELCKLCFALTGVLQLLYPYDGLYSVENRLDVLKRIYTYTDELNDWHDEMTAITETRNQHHKAAGVVTLFTSILDVYFQSTKAALCNYRIMLGLDNSINHNFHLLQAKNELQAALRGLAQSLRAIVGAGMVNYSPVSMVAYLALPSICYNLELSSRASTHKAVRERGTNIYQDFLRVLQLRYEGTDMALGNMSKLINDMNLEDVTTPSTERSANELSPAGQEALMRPPDKSTPQSRGLGVDIVVSEPKKYLQMIFTVDFFLSRGRFPTRADIPQDLLEGESERSTDLASVNDATGSGSKNVWSGSHQSEPAHPEFAGQASIPDSIWTAATPSESSGVMEPDRGQTANLQRPPTLSDDIFSQLGTNPDGFSFEDFMTDGPFTGIEQLQNILNRQSGWS